MKSKMIIHLNGKEFICESKDASASEQADNWYENIENVSKIKVKLVNGGFLILQKESFVNCALEFLIVP